LLSLIGGRMAFHALRRIGAGPTATQHSLALLVLTALATSVDAMAVGVTLAFVQVDIFTVATAIGVATFMMAAIGTLAGPWAGPRFRTTAPLVRGACV